MWDWFKRLCAAPETLTPLAGAAPFKRTPQQLTQAPPQASDAAKRRDQDAAPCPASGTGNPAVADSDAAAPATPLAPNPHKGAADCNGGGGGAPMTPTFSNAATAGTPAHTRAAAYTPEVSSRTPPHARTPDARAVAAGTPGGAGAAGREPSPFTPDAHAAGKGPGAGGRQVDEGTPGRARAPSMPPCTGASVASRVSTGGFLIEGGKTVGIPNTVSKYAPSKPLVQHVTPFERRVERRMADEEEEIARLQLDVAQDPLQPQQQEQEQQQA